jgi:hypothetical protein
MREIFTPLLATGLIFTLSFMFFEPELAKGATDEIVVAQSVTSEITISSPADVTMSPSIPGMTGNAGSPSTGSVTWTVTTNDTAGFNMTLAASTSPALKLDASNYFDDYTPATAGTPDYTWQSPASGAAEFGFTVEPATAADTVALFKDDGLSACNTGTNNGTDTCWYNFATSSLTVINRSSETSSLGEAEVVKFRAESNGKFLKEGSYTATIIATVVTN